MQPASPHFQLPLSVAEELAWLTSSLLTDLTLIQLAADGLRRIEAQRKSPRSASPRNRARLDRLARQDALLDQFEALRHEVSALHVDAALALEDADVTVPAYRNDHPAPPLDRRGSDCALIAIEAWWTSCVPALIDDARAGAARIAEALEAVASGTCLELAERLERFATSDDDSLIT